MATISRRITRTIGEHKLRGITIKRRNSKNGYTTPYKIYGPHKVIKTLSDPGHWEKKCWITMYCQFWNTVLQSGVLLPKNTLNYWTTQSVVPAF